jgi:putative phage-type endonuclease
MNVSNKISHPPEWHAARRTGVGSSEAAKIMAGDWHELWLEKTGRIEPDNLDDILAVQMGSYTEELNVFWFSKQTGLDVRIVKERMTHADYPHMHCELDGVTDKGPVECKHTSAWSKPDELLTRYFWQLQHQLAITGDTQIYLSVFFGNQKWEFFEVARDDKLIDELIVKEAEFWEMVRTDKAPTNPEAVAAPVVAIDDMREVDLTGNNEWAAAAADWADNQPAKNKFDKAVKSIKELVEPDVKLAAGHGVQAKRAKNGSIRITTTQKGN